MALFSFGCCCGCGTRSLAVAVTGALAVVVAVFTWRGGAPGRAVIPGLAAGVVPLLLPLLVRLGSALTVERGGARSALVVACVLAGIASGSIVAQAASGVPEDKAVFVVAGGAVAALAGTLGCFVVGLGGIAAMIAGLLLLSVPAALRPSAAGAR
jgi:hypothetical protein